MENKGHWISTFEFWYAIHERTIKIYTNYRANLAIIYVSQITVIKSLFSKQKKQSYWILKCLSFSNILCWKGYVLCVYLETNSLKIDYLYDNSNKKKKTRKWHDGGDKLHFQYLSRKLILLMSIRDKLLSLIISLSFEKFDRIRTSFKAFLSSSLLWLYIHTSE